MISNSTPNKMMQSLRKCSFPNENLKVDTLPSDARLTDVKTVFIAKTIGIKLIMMSVVKQNFIKSAWL